MIPVYVVYRGRPPPTHVDAGTNLLRTKALHRIPSSHLFAMPKKKGKGKKAAAQRSAGYFGPDADGRPSEAEWKRMEAAEELVTTKCKFRHGCECACSFQL